MTGLSRRFFLQAFSLAPLVLPQHHRAGHDRGSKPSDPVPSPAEPYPGPAGDFSFSGYNWLRRTWPGAPHYNGQWSGDNVVVNGDGTLTLRLTNAGHSPVAAELLSTRTAWGYGHYWLDFEANFDHVSPSVVWGNLFTYDSTQPDDASHNEIDAGEISAWGVPDLAPRLTAGYWLPGPANVLSHNEALPTGVRVFRSTMTWAPGDVSFATYAGITTADTLLAASRITSPGLPVPASERVHVNLWVTSANEDDESRAAPFEVQVNGFGFNPAASG